MTSRERIEAALNHREPDHTPIFEYVLLSPLADLFLGRPYAGDGINWDAVVEEKGWEAAVRQSAVDRLDLAAILGHDMLYVPMNAPPPSKSPVTYAPVIDDPVEVVKRRNEEATFQAPLSDDNLLIYACLQEEMKQRDMDLPILAPAYVHGVWTDVDLMQTMLLDPPVAHRHFQIATEKAIERVDKYVEYRIEMVGVGGDFSGTRPLISPQAYRAFIVPEVRKTTRRIHSFNAYAVNASDGNLWPVIDDFLFGCEVDGYLEIDMHAEMDMARLKADYGDRITLFGNLDCGNILSFGSPDTVRAHTIACLEAGMGNGGHILCASNAIIASVSPENYLAVIAAYRDMFGMPALKFG